MKKLREHNGGGATPLSRYSKQLDTIANKNYNSYMRKYSFKKGFTLAEVLITLGIIGVVAALTIPTLLAKYQQKTLNTQFKKSYALINQALRNVQAQYDYFPKCYYLPSDDPNNYFESGCADFTEKFFETLKVSKKCVGNAFADGCIPEYEGMDTVSNANNPDAEVPEGYEDYGEYESRGCAHFRKNAILNDRTVYVLTDGTIIFPYSNAMLIAVDINGLKGPNKWGYDLFSFMLRYDGSKLYYYGGGCMLTEEGGVKTGVMLQRLQNNQL